MNEEEVLKLLAATRRATWECAVRGMAHALGTPLNVVLGHAELLQEENQSPSSRSITTQVHTMEKLITRSIGYASAAPTLEDSVSGSELCALASKLLGPRAEEVSFHCSAVPVAVPRALGLVMLLGLVHYGLERALGARIELHCERSSSHVGFRLVCPSSSVGARSVRDMSEPWLADPIDSSAEALELAVALAACRSLRGAARREESAGAFSMSLSWPH